MQSVNVVFAEIPAGIDWVRYEIIVGRFYMAIRFWCALAIVDELSVVIAFAEPSLCDSIN